MTSPHLVDVVRVGVPAAHARLEARFVHHDADARGVRGGAVVAAVAVLLVVVLRVVVLRVVVLLVAMLLVAVLLVVVLLVAVAVRRVRAAFALVVALACRLS